MGSGCIWSPQWRLRLRFGGCITVCVCAGKRSFQARGVGRFVVWVVGVDIGVVLDLGSGVSGIDVLVGLLWVLILPLRHALRSYWRFQGIRRLLVLCPRLRRGAGVQYRIAFG